MLKVGKVVISGDGINEDGTRSSGANYSLIGGIAPLSCLTPPIG